MATWTYEQSGILYEDPRTTYEGLLVALTRTPQANWPSATNTFLPSYDLFAPGGEHHLKRIHKGMAKQFARIESDILVRKSKKARRERNNKLATLLMMLDD